MRRRSAVTSQFLCSRVLCGNATQLGRSMNRPLLYPISPQVLSVQSDTLDVFKLSVYIHANLIYFHFW